MAYGRKENKDVCYFLFVAYGKLITGKCIAALNVSWSLPQKIVEDVFSCESSLFRRNLGRLPGVGQRGPVMGLRPLLGPLCTPPGTPRWETISIFVG